MMSDENKIIQSSVLGSVTTQIGEQNNYNTETIKFTLIECLLNEPVTVHFLLDMV